MTNIETTLKNASAIPRDVALGAVNMDLYFRHRGKQACIQRAQAKPLPGPTAGAFTSGPIRVAGKIVSRVVPAHFAVLQAVNSPLLTMIENAMTAKKVEVDFKPQEQWDICFIFTSDSETVYTLLEAEGAKAVQKASRKAIGNEWEASAVNLVMMAVLEQIKRHVETLVKYSGELDGSGEITFFQEVPEKT